MDGASVKRDGRFFARVRPPRPRVSPSPPPGWPVAGRSGPATEGADPPMGWGRQPGAGEAGHSARARARRKGRGGGGRGRVGQGARE